MKILHSSNNGLPSITDKLLITGILLATATCATLRAQDTLTLEECLRLAVEEAPRMKDMEEIRTMGSLKADQPGTAWYPSMELNGRVSYQSDVVSLALDGAPFPLEFPDVPKDQYGFSLDLKQMLFDGGVSRNRKAYEEAVTSAELQEVEVDVFGIKPRVNQLYYSILVLQENRRNQGLHLESLAARLEALEVAVGQGAALESEMQVIQVEMLKIRQSIIGIDSQVRVSLQVLGVLCGRRITEETLLVLPEWSLPEDPAVNRPEHRLFDLQQATLQAGKQVLNARRLPVIYAFGQAGYGKPGYNMLNDEWDTYYRVGAGISWTIWDWNETERQRNILSHQQNMLKNRRMGFDRDLSTRIAGEEARISQYQQMLQLDETALALRVEISERAASQLENGTLTATGYLLELNQEMMSRIRLSTHRIQLSQSKANLKTLKGEF